MAMTVNLRNLVDKLNRQTRNAVEGAAGLCVNRSHYDVEVEHYLTKLLDVSDGDLGPILGHFGVDRSRLARELTECLDELSTGNARTPSLSPALVETLTEAWTIGSLDFGATKIRSGYTILALASEDDLRRRLREVSDDYWAPVGVWQVRESVRNAFDGEHGEARDFSSAVSAISEHLPVSLARLRRKSSMVAGLQSSLDDWA
jgi:ATP-dependent Clp protease ATP-binding subunit ClpA